MRQDKHVPRPVARNIQQTHPLVSGFLPFGIDDAREAGRRNVSKSPMQGIIGSPMNELLGSAKLRGSVDRNDDRPFQAFRTVNGYDFNGLALRIQRALRVTRATGPIIIKITGKLPETAHAL